MIGIWGRARIAATALAVAAGLLAPAAHAAADVLVLANGRKLSVRTHTVDGDAMTVTLPGGGVVTFQLALVARIDPEEIPEMSDGEATGRVASASPEFAASAPAAAPGPQPYAALIDDVAGRHGLDPRLVHAIVRAESNYQPRARSFKGARGLMQLLPTTGAALGARNLYDPSTNLEAGVRYLKGLLSEFTLPEALAAYNAGPATVRRFGGIPPYLETQRYVERVMDLLNPTNR